VEEGVAEEGSLLRGPKQVGPGRVEKLLQLTIFPTEASWMMTTMTRMETTTAMMVGQSSLDRMTSRPICILKLIFLKFKDWKTSSFFRLEFGFHLLAISMFEK
jgi:hypothetical protein